MKYYEYSKMLNNQYLRMLSAIKPIIAIQNQTYQAVKPFTEIQKNFAKLIAPAQAIQNQLIAALEPMYLMQEIVNQANIALSSTITAAIKSQIEFLNILSNTSLNSMSIENSLSFSEISTKAMSELEYDDLPQEIIETKDIVTEISSTKKPLTWEQILTIISFIITVCMFVQSLLPNKQLSTIEKYLEQLIEIQMNEISSISAETAE